ncbi:transcription termination factor NusA [Dehalobacter sp. DCM]|uniref:transcription termination factor NusA n=1 Tax=Dehalobacter sp. DCM TaxID=2907827 RepID=UPI003081D120|nr:transcription termination factor NusA [Dehalobacter sp. DCM]
MNMEFIEAIHELEKEKGISTEILFEAIEAALISAYKKNFSSLQNVRVHIDRVNGEIKVYARKNIVEEVEDARTQIALEEAKKLDPNYVLDDVVEFEVTPRDFGRIAAQTAKQVVVQRIREAERGMIYDEYINREGDIVTGIVQRYEQRNVIVDLGKVEAVLPASEQNPGESYQPFERIKAYVVEVKKTTKGPQILLSRTHPGLIKRLFELEVPEIHDGIVEIKAVAREAGARSKIAVYSKDKNVDPVGACVGPKGSRVQNIVNELKGEKMDIINWSLDPIEFVSNALSPAKVLGVYPRYDDKVTLVVVPDYQLSLAIGKEGQNARLAAKLTGWKIDIKNETQAVAQNLIPPEEYLDETGEGEYYEEYDEYEDGDYTDEYPEGEYSDYDEEGYDEYAEEGYESDDYSEPAEGYTEYEEDYEEGYEEYAEGEYTEYDNDQYEPVEESEAYGEFVPVDYIEDEETAAFPVSDTQTDDGDDVGTKPKKTKSSKK